MQIIWNDLTKIMIKLITGSTRFILSRSHFPVKLKVQTNRGTHDGQNIWHAQKDSTFTDFLRRYSVTHK